MVKCEILRGMVWDGEPREIGYEIECSKAQAIAFEQSGKAIIVDEPEPAPVEDDKPAKPARKLSKKSISKE